MLSLSLLEKRQKFKCILATDEIPTPLSIKHLLKPVSMATHRRLSNIYTRACEHPTDKLQEKHSLCLSAKISEQTKGASYRTHINRLTAVVKSAHETIRNITTKIH